LKLNRQSRFQKLLPGQIRRKTQSTINTNTIRKLKPSRNQTFQKLQRRNTVYARPNKYTSNHTTNLSSGRRLTDGVTGSVRCTSFVTGFKFLILGG
jgi:hypothetical protein